LPESPLSPVSPFGVRRARFPIEPGGRVLFHRQEVGGQIDIYLLDLDSGGLTRLTEGEGNNYDPAWSPDGASIAFVSDRALGPPYGTVWLMDADGSGPRALLEAGRYLELGPTWSPDGTRIAFHSNREGNLDILVLDVESGELTNLTRHSNVDANPAWSPDGATMAFTSDRSGNPEVWVINVDGTGLQQITQSPLLGDWRPAWSPDGRALAFESFPTVAPRLVNIQALDGTEAHEVETFSIWNMWPAWVTNDLVLYAASEEYDEDAHEGSPANLYLQNLKTDEIIQLTTGSGDDGHPSWRP
jgi:TolB protein